MQLEENEELENAKKAKEDDTSDLNAATEVELNALVCYKLYTQTHYQVYA